MKTPNFYDVLGVSPDAEDVVIRASYKALVQKYHPDRFEGTQELAAKKTKELNMAISVLSDPQKRRRYDEMLQNVVKREQSDERDRNPGYGVESTPQLSSEEIFKFGEESDEDEKYARFWDELEFADEFFEGEFEKYWKFIDEAE